MTGAEQPVRIRMLGGFSVSVGSRTTAEGDWRLKKAAGLVKLLALAPGRRLHREQAMDLLWPNSGRKAASNNLRQALHAVRRTLSPDPAAASRYLSSEGESLVLCPGGPLWVDVEAFEEAATAARRSREPAAYRAAFDLYAGELSPEDRYEAWAEDRRLGLQQLYLALLVELTGLHEGRGEHGPAIEALQEATAEEPTLEEAHAALMRLFALSGRPERALAQYERLREALSGGPGTRPAADIPSRRRRDIGRQAPVDPAYWPPTAG